MKAIAKIFFYYDTDEETIQCIIQAICAKGMRLIKTDFPNEYEIKGVANEGK